MGTYKVGTFELSKQLGISHRTIKNLILRFKSDFLEFGEIKMMRNQKSEITGGRPVSEILLGEEHCLLLVLYLPASKNTAAKKMQFIREFRDSRRAILGALQS